MTHNKILIVEDEKSIAQAYSDHLTREGYNINLAYDGIEGLAMAKTIMPDLILLDIVMPKMDGISMLRRLKEDPQLDEIPVIILTNLESKESAMEAYKMGSSNYLVKTNYSLDDVTNKIKDVIVSRYGA